MRIISPAVAALSVLAVAFVIADGRFSARAQSAPVQAEQTPGQSDQSRAQDRSRAEDVKIGRDWKAQDAPANAGRADNDRTSETVSRDWRAQESNIGTIARVDEAKGTLAISTVEGTTGSSNGAATQEYKVQDGLVFNAVREGDKVSFAVENKDGNKTITKLQKQ